MHPLLKKKYSCWRELECAIESVSDNKEKGDIFEEYAYFFLIYHKEFYQIKEIFCPVVDGKPFPKAISDRLKLEKKDYGVDGVYITNDGNITAYQAKFRSGRGIPTASELSSFWAEAEYADYRCVITNSAILPKVSGKKKNHVSILLDKFETLDDTFFKSLQSFANTSRVIVAAKFSPRDYQQKMIDEITTGFKSNRRGKYISACGSGKTLVSLWVSEKMNTQNVIFLAPSLALIRQTLEEWVLQRNQPFSYLCVCSDVTVGKNVENDEINLSLDEMDIPVSTSEIDIIHFLSRSKGKRVIFSTYQSLDVVRKAINGLKTFKFDLMIFDEAHRTAGVKDSNMFSIGLNDTAIPSEKRLFMTATERLVTPNIQKRLTDAQRIVFSMDDQSNYGPVFSRLTFGEAIRRKIVSDYRIVIAGVTDKQLYQTIKDNRYLVPSTGGSSEITADNLFKAILLTNTIAELNVKKIVTFHSFLKKSREFSKIIDAVIPKSKRGDFFIGTVEGSQSSADRIEIYHCFENSDIGIISNVRCMTEGVNIPIIDAIYFADPRQSLIDIVQAVGRALRQPYGETGKIAYILVPILIPESSSTPEIVNSELFETVYSVIQALRDQDEQLAEWIDELNLTAIKGQVGRRSYGSGKIVLNLPDSINLNDFREKISVRIASVNKDPSGTTGIGSKLGKKERISSYKRIFTTLGDYNPEPYSRLVIPTIYKFSDENEVLTSKTLMLNHNNISHTERLGLIQKDTQGKYHLTSLGKKLRSKIVSFNDVFKNRMITYSVNTEGGVLYPYQTTFRVIEALGSINYIEFLYGLYSIKLQNNDITKAEDDVIQMIMWIRKNYPNVNLTNKKNQDSVREALNSRHHIGFNSNDVWTDRTTAGNQFRYLMRHLELFGDVFVTDWKTKTIRLTPNGRKLIKVLLN